MRAMGLTSVYFTLCCTSASVNLPIVGADVPLERSSRNREVHVSEIDEAILRKFQKELNAGTVSLVLLAILAGSEEAMYGYQIAKSIEALHEGTPVKQGTLYPVLRSMGENGLLESRVEPSVSGPPRKYYSITDHGREVLEAWKEAWSRTRDFVDETLEGNVG